MQVTLVWFYSEVAIHGIEFRFGEEQWLGFGPRRLSSGLSSGLSSRLPSRLPTRSARRLAAGEM